MCTSLMNWILDIRFVDIATAMIAASIAYVAWSQYLLSKSKFKLDLFEKRFKVFEATRIFLDAASSSGGPTSADFDNFHTGNSGDKFLFDSDISDYLTEIDSKASNIQIGNCSENLQIESLAWIQKQLGGLESKFRPYMAFESWK